jgi:ABC-type nitrate/sulfonate/bicarbonate transport system ATPase subunit
MTAAAPPQPKISVRHLEKAFPRRDGQPLLVIQDLSLDVAPGEFLCLLGPSGCGKSTLLNMIGNVDQPTRGEVVVDGVPLRPGGATPRIGFVFQSPRLVPWKTTWSNVRFSLETDGTLPKAEWDDRVREALALVGVAGFETAYPSQLSGGMQTRVAIARALAIRPDIILMDEPFSSLDEITGRRMRAELLDIWERVRPTVVFITHDMLEAVFLAERVVLLTPRPMSVYATLTVDVPRPRSYMDEKLFDVQRTVLETFERMCAEAETPAAQ